MTPQTDTVREATIKRIYDAPVRRVWDAFVQADQVKEWYGPEGFTIPSAEIDLRVGGAFSIIMRGPDGVDYPDAGTFIEIDPPHRLVMDHDVPGPGGTKMLRALTAITFEERGGKTELTLHARGEALVPDAIPMLGGMEAGWAQSLRTLDDVITGAIGRRFVVVKLLNAPRERVYEAFTTPEQVAQWWGPEGFMLTTTEHDLRPGGIWRFTMHGPDGTDYPQVVTFEELTPPMALRYHHGASEGFDDRPFTASVDLDEMMGMTVVTMKGVFASTEDRDHVEETFGAIEGANQTLDRLEAFLT